jgi:aspartyl-tRNA(Asn)/glutamyl-tRNA(Gln) amidotransferase subunit C
MAMAITGDTIRDIAQLARLRVEERELPELTHSFNACLELFEALQAAPTEGVEPMANPLDATQPLRDDIVDPGDTGDAAGPGGTADSDDALARREALQAVAPLVEDGLYLVPRVIE